ncbi:MAG: tRNA (adenosine(37)-N6)-threonylcarbamoyltransferase complex ATPase subunit type 1 TsaE [Bacteroidales bacterium]|nr:tRNA (adenosine(37)-N6)-threonylcarbamoyltransferase complex ATPase subunit type 1 TsaE [Bacteroidales bacterium]MBP5420299.1 tRNA (adenosine(37)-N6)-threonylcarbamoyltransferase complex ATPase subunit type 1 TsaE [Bacteroidales bacterium]MCR5695494.1 tRNA (adenosine(37)-N6)-threonylcarbamoyltransferase complex ATPase subunit type 1 TsaE [Marinilabiliaceae bacterium]
MKIEVRSLEELDSSAAEIINAIGSRRVVAFYAPMGAGKTTLISALAKQLGSTSITNSPTFAIVNDYELPNGDSIYHFDLYRLKSTSELIDVGCDDYFSSGCYCFVEWPELAEPLMPNEVCNITIKVAADGTREIEVD